MKEKFETKQKDIPVDIDEIKTYLSPSNINGAVPYQGSALINLYGKQCKLSHMLPIPFKGKIESNLPDDASMYEFVEGIDLLDGSYIGDPAEVHGFIDKRSMIKVGDNLVSSLIWDISESNSVELVVIFNTLTNEISINARDNVEQLGGEYSGSDVYGIDENNNEVVTKVPRGSSVPIQWYDEKPFFESVNSLGFYIRMKKKEPSVAVEEIDAKFDSLLSDADSLKEYCGKTVDLVYGKPTDDTSDEYRMLTDEETSKIYSEVLNVIKDSVLKSKLDPNLESIKRITVYYTKSEDGTVVYNKLEIIDQLYALGLIDDLVQYHDDIEYDENQLPVIDENDVKSLTFFGIQKDIINIVKNGSIDTIANAKNDIKEGEKLLCSSKDDYMAGLEKISKCEPMSKEMILAISSQYENMSKYTSAELSIENATKYIKDSINHLANFQIMARTTIKRHMESNDFNNYHSFTSAMLFFSIMKQEGILSADGGVDNYGSFPALVKFTNKIYEDLSPVTNDDIGGINVAKFFSSILLQSLIKPEDISKSSISSLFTSLCKSTVRFDKQSDDTLDDLYSLIESKFNYIHSLATTAIINNVYPAFDITDDEEKFVFPMFSEKNVETNVKNKTTRLENGWKYDDLSNVTIGSKENLLYIAKELRSLIDSNQETLFNFFKRILAYNLKTLEENAAKKKKKDNKIVLVSKTFVALSINETINTIVSETEGVDLTTKIMKVMIDLSATTIFLSMLIRLLDRFESHNYMDGVQLKDLNTFFSTFLGAVSVSSDVVSFAKDNGVNDDLFKTAFTPKQRGIVGTDAIKLHLGGIPGFISESKGVGDEGITVTNLSRARSDLLQSSMKYTSQVYELALSSIKRILSDIDKSY